MDFFVAIFEEAGDLIEWTSNFGRWTLLAAGCLFIGISYFVSRSPRH